ncbi:MAG: T9SS type A sorting domain-containing protein [Bacteroidota bacterium]
MKAQLQLLSFCIFLLLLGNTLWGQTEVEFIFSDARNVRLQNHLTTPESVFSVGSRGTCKGAVYHHIDFAISGTFITAAQGGHWEYDDIDEVQTALGNLHIVCGDYYQADDFPSPEDGPYVLGLLDGDPVFETALPKIDWEWNSFSSPGMSLTVDGNSRLIAVHRDIVFQLTETGELLNTGYFLDAEFVAIETWNATHTLALGINKLYWLDANIVATDSLTFSGEGLDLWVQANRIFVLTDQELLVVTDANTFSTHNDFYTELTPRGLTGNGESLFVWGADLQSGFDEIVQLDDQNLTVLSAVPFSRNETSIRHLTATATHLMVSGEYRPGLGYYTAFNKSLTIGEAPLFEHPGIGLSNFVSSSEWTYTSFVADPSVPIIVYNYRLNPFDFSFDLTNHGTETLESFTLIGESQGSFNCAQGRLVQHFRDLAIPPGETQTLSGTSSIALQATTDPVPPALQFYVFAPNHQFDIAPEDNNAIIDLLVPTETVTTLEQVRLQPNPASEQLTLTLSTKQAIGMLDWQIYNAQGQLLLRETQNITAHHFLKTIEVQQWATGIYWLHMHTDGGALTQRFVVQH